MCILEKARARWFISVRLTGQLPNYPSINFAIFSSPSYSCSSVTNQHQSRKYQPNTNTAPPNSLVYHHNPFQHLIIQTQNQQNQTKNNSKSTQNNLKKTQTLLENPSQTQLKINPKQNQLKIKPLIENP